MKQIIINADDFGFSEGINKGIIESYKNGIATSTSIVCNTEYFHKSIKELRRLKGLGKGVHLNLTMGKPVSRDVPSLTNKNGLFEKDVYRFSLRASISKIHKEDIKKELEGQIKLAVSKFEDIDHIDSHQHIHILPQIYPIVLMLARKYKISFVRLPQQHITPEFWNRLPERIVLNALCKIADGYDTNYKRHINYFCGFWHGGLNEPIFSKIVNSIKEGVCEFMCHPAYPDSFIGKNWSGLKADRTKDLKTLTSPVCRRLVEKNKIKLIRFADLT